MLDGAVLVVPVAAVRSALVVVAADVVVHGIDLPGGTWIVRSQLLMPVTLPRPIMFPPSWSYST